MSPKDFCGNCRLHKEICVCPADIKKEMESIRCKRCSRFGETFVCNWCSMEICDKCMYKEHEEDDCRNPDDCCYSCQKFLDECECE